LYYDHILTFPMEVEYLWKSFHGPSKYMFLLNRYFSTTGNTIVTISLFSSFLASGPVSSCGVFHLFREILLFLTQVIVCILLTLRIYALYGRKKRVLIYMLSFGFLLGALAFFHLFGQNSSSSLTSFGCHTQLQFITYVILRLPTFAWEALFIYDSMLLIMMVRKGLKARQSLGRIPLLELVLRDGALYYAVMALANLGNILTFYLAGPYMRGGLSTFSSATSVTMMSRLTLNLHFDSHKNPPTTFRSTARFAMRTGYEDDVSDSEASTFDRVRFKEHDSSRRLPEDLSVTDPRAV
ncbi:hypothetical protein K435DRAFT_668402, partial [Dendrothele bispora CBS 962.96]